MTGPDRLYERITDQFSYRGERADIWRAFDYVLATDAFLNLGYSKWYQPCATGASQRRLATQIGRTLSAQLPTTGGVRLLDVGCGRGGPAIRLADQFGFRVTGIDLVPYNVTRATENAAERGVDAEFVVGDATQLPIAAGSLPACTSVDAFVYFPDRRAVFEAIVDALEPGGTFVFSDLVARPDLAEDAQRAVAAFADVWDMPPLGSVPAYEDALEAVGFDVRTVEDLTSHSVGRFRKWTTLYRKLHATPVGDLIDRLLERRGLDAETIDEQVRYAHEALPFLQHALFIAEQ